jgi:hypothetical protein
LDDDATNPLGLMAKVLLGIVKEYLGAKLILNGGATMYLARVKKPLWRFIKT